MEYLALGVRRPAQIEALAHTADNILREVAASDGLDIMDEILHLFDVFSEVLDSEALFIAVVAVSYEADPHGQLTITVCLHVVDYSRQSLLGSLDPRGHRIGAVEEQSQLQVLLAFLDLLDFSLDDGLLCRLARLGFSFLNGLGPCRNFVGELNS